MGSNRKLIFGAVLVVAALVFWGLLRALNGVNRVAAKPTAAPVARTASLPPGGRLIAYAASDIPQGTLVTKSMIQMRVLPGNGPITSFVTDPQAQALNFVTGTRIPKGALIRPSDDFVGHISDVGIAGMLQPGRRAIVIPFANKPTLHDLVAIGNLVDINAAFDGQESRTIVPAVRVLAVDVFGSDFPQVNIARRGAYKADSKAEAPGSSLPVAGAEPGATPTPTPAPAQGAARPDPAITLEVTPEQANRILLTQASGGVLDFVVLPTRNAILVDDAGTTPDGTPIGGEIGQLISAVTKPQLAPYAERKKAGAGTGTTRTASTNAGSGSSSSGSSGRGSRFTRANNFGDPPPLPSPNGSAGSGANTPFPLPTGEISPIPTAESPTYNIPIYADGRTVRVETVQRPQE